MGIGVSIELAQMQEQADADVPQGVCEPRMTSEETTAMETVALYHQICDMFSLQAQDAKQYSPLTLAYIGDAIYEVIVRTVLVEKGNAPVNTLHKRASKLVKAEAQKDAFFRIKELLSEEEMAVFKRGRNAKSYTSAKNATIGDYRIATGYEALFGYWYLSGQTERMLEVAKIAISAL